MKLIIEIGVDLIVSSKRSSIVEKILLNAHEEGKRFSVIVVDSRPLLEGPHNFLDGGPVNLIFKDRQSVA